jgi:hypothetical protein
LVNIPPERYGNGNGHCKQQDQSSYLAAAVKQRSKPSRAGVKPDLAGRNQVWKMKGQRHAPPSRPGRAGSVRKKRDQLSA